jgi:hypothetical protein
VAGIALGREDGAHVAGEVDLRFRSIHEQRTAATDSQTDLCEKPTRGLRAAGEEDHACKEEAMTTMLRS